MKKVQATPIHFYKIRNRYTRLPKYLSGLKFMSYNAARNWLRRQVLIDSREGRTPAYLRDLMVYSPADLNLALDTSASHKGSFSIGSLGFEISRV